MSEQDLPERLERYDGDHVVADSGSLSRKTIGRSSVLSGRRQEERPAIRLVCRNYGNRCWELDALDPNVLRACVEEKIRERIEPVGLAALQGCGARRARIAARGM